MSSEAPIRVRPGYVPYVEGPISKRSLLSPDLIFSHRPRDPEEFLNKYGYVQMKIPNHTGLHDMAVRELGLESPAIPAELMQEVQATLAPDEELMRGVIGLIGHGGTIAFKPEKFIFQDATPEEFADRTEMRTQALDKTYGEEDAFKIGLATTAELLYILKKSDSSTLGSFARQFPQGVAGFDFFRYVTFMKGSEVERKYTRIIATTLHLEPGHTVPTLHASLHTEHAVYPQNILPVVLTRSSPDE